MWECLTGLIRSAVHEFIQCIAEEQQAILQASVQSGNFFSVMVDGTTDSSVTEAEIIYIRYTSWYFVYLILLG